MRDPLKGFPRPAPWVRPRSVHHRSRHLGVAPSLNLPNEESARIRLLQSDVLTSLSLNIPPDFFKFANGNTLLLAARSLGHMSLSSWPLRESGERSTALSFNTELNESQNEKWSQIVRQLAYRYKVAGHLKAVFLLSRRIIPTCNYQM